MGSRILGFLTPLLTIGSVSGFAAQLDQPILSEFHFGLFQCAW